MFAIGVLRSSDKRYFEHVLNDLRNEFQLGRDSYPPNHTRSLDLMQNYHPADVTSATNTAARNESSSQASTYSPGTNLVSTSSEAPTEDMQFTQTTPTHAPVQQSNTVPGTNGIGYPKITCYYCEARGHYADFCPDLNKKSAKKSSVGNAKSSVGDTTPKKVDTTCKPFDMGPSHK